MVKMKNLTEFDKTMFHKGLRPETRSRYTGVVTDFLSHYEANIPNAEAFLDAKTDKGCSGTYRNLCHYALQTYFRWLDNDNKLKFPFALPKRDEHVQPSFSLDQIQKMIKIAKGDTADYLLLRILFATGIRRSELVGIEKRDLTQSGDSFFLIIRKPKGRQERKVPIDDDTAHIIQRQRIKGKLFDIPARDVTTIVNAYASKIGARAIRTGAHSIRRSYATILHDRGTDIFDLQAAMGHRNLEQTRKYVEVSDQRLSEVFKKAHPLGRENNDR